MLAARAAHARRCWRSPRSACCSRRDHLRRAALVPARPRRPAGPDGRAGRRGAARRAAARSAAGAASARRAAGRPARRRPAAAARRPAPICRRAPTGSCATPQRQGARRASDLRLSRQPELPAEDPGRAARSAPRTVFTVHGRPGVRATAPPPTRRGPGAGTVVAAVPLRDVDQTLDQLLLVEGLVIAAVLLGAAALAWFVVRVGLRPLDRMGRHRGRDRRRRPLAPRRADRRRAPRSAASGSRSTRCSTGSSARSREREASEDRLRRFLADASHELRTPLASIRGYAELFRHRRRARPGRASRRRCAGSRTRRRAWACSSRTC